MHSGPALSKIGPATVEPVLKLLFPQLLFYSYSLFSLQFKTPRVPRPSPAGTHKLKILDSVVPSRSHILLEGASHTYIEDC